MKKKVPLLVLEALEKYVHLKGENFEVIQQKDTLLKVVDKDEDSDFYFSVVNFRSENSFKLLIDFKPSSKTNTGNTQTWIEGKALDNYFKTWTELLRQYDSINSFFDDPIVKSFADEYYAEFEILDDDANEPLRSRQILLLDNYLEFIESNIERFQTDQNRENVQEIKAEVVSLRSNITNKSKQWIVKKLSKIWGKLTKEGVKFMKEFISEAKKKAIQEGIKFIMENGTDFLNNTNP